MGGADAAALALTAGCPILLTESLAAKLHCRRDGGKPLSGPAARA